MKKFIIIILFVCCFFNGYTQGRRYDPAKLRLDFSGGIGYRKSIPGDQQVLTDSELNSQTGKDSYINLKWGFEGNADLHYLFLENLGAGIKYSIFTSSGSMDASFNLPPTDSYNAFAFQLEEKDYIHYLGPSIYLRSFLWDSKFTVSANLSVGYVYYKENMNSQIIFTQTQTIPTNLAIGQPTDTPDETPDIPVLSPDNITTTGNTYGAYGGIGMEYFMSRNIAFGFNIGYFYSSLNEISIVNKIDATTSVLKEIKLKEATGKKEDLSRLDFSVGIKIYL